MWDLILQAFNTPSDFSGDLYGSVTNQAGHALLIGYGFFMILSTFFRKFHVALILVFGYILFEVLQFYMFGSYTLLLVSDGLLDTFFVFSGLAIGWFTIQGNLVKIRLLTFILFLGFTYLIYGI